MVVCVVWRDGLFVVVLVTLVASRPQHATQRAGVRRRDPFRDLSYGIKL